MSTSVTMLLRRPLNVSALDKIGQRFLATVAPDTAPPVLGLDEAALDLLPAPVGTPIGLTTSPSTRTSRLEYHYLNSIREDQMLLHYDHASKLMRTLDRNPEWTEGLKVQEGLLARVFGVQEPVARDRVKGGGPKRYGPPTPTSKPLFLSTPLRRPFKNPIDYTTHKPNKEWRILPRDPHPFAPLPWRFPKLESITLSVFPPKANQNKMSVLSSIMALQSISGLKADPFFAPINEATREWKIGQVAGATVTIDSGDRMWSFLDRFVNCVLPRIREWPGFDSRAAWQGNGELRVFVDAQAVGYFPEIESYFDQYPALYDLEVSFNTNTKFRNEAVTLLSGFQIPFLGREVEMRMQEEAKKKQESSDPFAKYRAKNKRKSGMGARGGQTVARGSTKR